MKTPRFLTIEEVLEIHAYQIERHGGVQGVLNPAQLESAVAQPAMGLCDTYFHDFPFGMAAAYLFHLSLNHAFRDGNKRVGTHAALVFLHMNGYACTASEDALYEMSMAVARGELEKPAIRSFFEANCAPR